MPSTVKGVIARSKKQPVEVVDIVVPDPGPGEALVKVQACGVCHTDLHYREGGINDEFPFLLGHEAAGLVESVGEGVTDVAPGDFVILNWRAVCGECRACKRGEPQYCFDTHNATQKMTLTDGTELSPALGIGAFAEKTLVAAGQCTKVDPSAPPTVAGLLGCGVMAGLGAAVNTGAIRRGQSIAVIGCGGVGSAAIAGARLVGASTIIAVDFDDRKLAGATE
ncbi:alcohol dehydrogenase catalytic domain-containing protein, partial [Jatrophihabitans endophyticus]|uniref:alcohol dehydrogenase catalytic domain-containing protein n=1 Tax=Jatrophihabitans endophyticus TaxID=1206085 RepID=UPI0019DF3B56